MNLEIVEEILEFVSSLHLAFTIPYKRLLLHNCSFGINFCEVCVILSSIIGSSASVKINFIGDVANFF